MNKMIFVNLPVKDLHRSMDFFAKMGYTFNPQFTDENAACLVISEDIFAMLLVKDFFKNFIKKEIADTTKTAGVIISLTTESRAEVDETLAKAIASRRNRDRNHGRGLDVPARIRRP